MNTPPPNLDWKTYASVVGKRVKELRKQLSLSQESLAEQSGLSRNQIQNIERGHATGVNGRATNLSMESLYGLAYALSVPPIVLLPDVEFLVERRARSAEHPTSVEELMHRTIKVDVTWPQSIRVEQSDSAGTGASHEASPH